MKHMKKSYVQSAAAAALIVFAPVAYGVATAVAAEQATTIPATAAEIWKAIDMHMMELHADIKKSALNKVHEHAFAVRDLVRALPTHSPGLSADAIAKVNGQIKFVDTLAERLDQTGDANDKAGTEANTVKLETSLKSIRANYPADK
ncbi:MAG: transporter [Micropepsaceae bacterium]